MQSMLTLEELTDSRGSDVYSSEGDRIGSVEEIFVDEETKQPEWIGLGTGFFKTKRVVVPAIGAARRDDGLYLPYSSDLVKETPDFDSDTISQETEQALYTHYGLEYSERRSDTGLPEGQPDSPGDTTEGAPAVTRSEEELRVGKREMEAGRLRLHKWVEMEQVDVPVELRREKARVTREAVDASASGAEIGEESIEVTLSEEQPVVQKQTVAKERIRVDKDVEVQQETVRDEVRKERVELDETTR